MGLVGRDCAMAGSRGLGTPHVDALVLGEGGLRHYRRRLDRPDRAWERLGTVSAAATGPGRLVRRGRALLAVVPEGEAVVCYRLRGQVWLPDNSNVLPPQKPAAPTPTAEQLGVVPDRLCAVAVVAETRGRLVLTDEAGSVFSYQRVGGRWERDSCLRLGAVEPFIAAATESVKIAQVSGDRDATPLPNGEHGPTLSDSLATAGIKGTDLGVRVDHAGRTYLLFGDTHWTRPWLATRDSVAEVLNPAEARPVVRFHGSPLKLVGRAAGRVTMREYDVPLGGFSHGGAFYGFFTSNHFVNRRTMGRSVLARAVDPDPEIDPAARHDPMRFEVLAEFSRRHFINVSVQVRPASAVPGWDGDGEVLLVWGTGAYRASGVRLAAASLRDGFWSELRYWADGQWVGTEEEAQELFSPAAMGELSVGWVESVGRYLMLAGSGPEDPIGYAIVLRSAPEPWGPWSPRVRLLDWIATGMSPDPHARFIKSSADDAEIGDRVFRAQARVGGAAYAPYLFDASIDSEDLVLRYTLSTWNPYQVILMEHRLPLGESWLLSATHGRRSFTAPRDS